MQNLLNKKNILFSKHKNITIEDINEIDKIIEHELEEKRKYIKSKDNEYMKIINYFSKSENKFLKKKFSSIFIDPSIILSNPNIPLDLIEKIDIMEYEWGEWLSRNINLDIDFVLKSSKKWNWNYITANNGMTIKNIIETELYEKANWNFNDFIHENENLTFQHILFYELFKDWHSISKHKNFTLPLINNYIDKINFYTVSENPNINIEFVLKYQKVLSWKSLSKNSGIKLIDIEQNINLPWEWEYVSINPNLTINFVKKYIEKKWDWNSISRNMNITMYNIEKNIWLPWSWHDIACNPNITLNFILRHIDKVLTSNEKYKDRKKLIDFDSILISNKFLFTKQLYKKYMQRDIKKRKKIIKNILKNYIYDDLNTLICDYIYL